MSNTNIFFSVCLQDTKKYSSWAVTVRQWWKEGLRRVYLFWVFFVVLTILVIVCVSTDLINWDDFNRDMFYTNEVGRAFLASFILVMDFTIVMQVIIESYTGCPAETGSETFRGPI